jgi:hypothetical protein
VGIFGFQHECVFFNLDDFEFVGRKVFSGADFKALERHFLVFLKLIMIKISLVGLSILQPRSNGRIGDFGRAPTRPWMVNLGLGVSG